jgi:hypothetical protein
MRSVLHREKTTERITGRVLDKGLGGDEMGERVRLVIDGADGRVHRVELDASRAVEIGRGMIVAAASAPSGPRPADRNIMDIADARGIYRPSVHLERARAAIDRIGGDPDAFIRSHVRRLETLRRAGHVERIDTDHWRVPAERSVQNTRPALTDMINLPYLQSMVSKGCIPPGAKGGTDATLSRHERPLVWIGSTKNDISKLPKPVKASFGYRLRRIQKGLPVPAAKALAHFGTGVYELREAS